MEEQSCKTCTHCSGFFCCVTNKPIPQKGTLDGCTRYEYDDSDDFIVAWGVENGLF